MDQQQPLSEHQYLESKANQSRGSVAWYLLPFIILIRPGRFMLSWGIHANIVWILFAAWIVGAGRMTNWVINQQRLDANPLPFKIESWTTLFLVLGVLGLLRGAFEYGLGGAWTWLKLRICGIRGNEWNRSTRIYLFARLVEMVPALLLLIYFTQRYTGLREYISQPVAWPNYVVMVFFFLSPIIAYLGVKSCYSIQKAWGVVLFLVWPLLWRAVIFGGAIIYTSTSNPLAGPYPDTQHPVVAARGVLKFEYPDGWKASITDPEGPSSIEATIISENEMGSLVIRVQPREEVDLIQYDLGLLAELGYKIISSTQAPNIRFEQQRGDGVDYIINAGPSENSKQYKMLHLLVHFDVDHDVLFRFMATERYWRAALEGWKQILATLEIGDLYQIAPDISAPMGINREVYSFNAPGNWNLSESQRDPFTNLEISAKQYSWFTTMIIDRDMTAQAELDLYLNHSIDDQLVSFTTMTTWMGLHGVGVQGQLQKSLAGYQQFKAFYTPLADGRIFVVKMYQAESSTNLTNPGFNLIESTFKLLVEPAEVDP